MKAAWLFETSGTTGPAQCMYQNTWVCLCYPLYQQLTETAAAISEEKLHACNTSYYTYNCHNLESSSLAHSPPHPSLVIYQCFVDNQG